MPTTDQDKILLAISDLKKDLTERFDTAIKTVKEMTLKDIQHIESDIYTLKQESAAHFKEEKNLLGKFADSIVAHAQEDVRHIEEVDTKIDVIGAKLNTVEQRLTERVDKVENKAILKEGEEKGKKSTGGSINTWVAFGFMILFGVFNLYTIYQGAMP